MNFLTLRNSNSVEHETSIKPSIQSAMEAV